MNHPRIVHLCDVKGGFPLKVAYYLVMIYLSYFSVLFSSTYIKFGFRSLDPRVFICKIITTWRRNLDQLLVKILCIGSLYFQRYGPRKLGLLYALEFILKQVF